MKLRVLLFAGLCVIAGQSLAGLFSDDEAHMKIQRLEGRSAKLEEKLQEAGRQQAENNKQQTQAMLDLQTQIENLNAELRKLRGQNEELVHNLQDTEKRQKDFYVDLDNRVRHFETLEATAAAAPRLAPPPTQPEKVVEIPPTEGPGVENRAYEAAYGLAKAGNHQKAVSAYQDFLKKFPDSVFVPSVHYELGNAYAASKDCKNAIESYQELLNKYDYSNKVPDAMLGIAECERGLNDKAAARKTLKKIIAKYPGSDIAEKARNRLKSIK